MANIQYVTKQGLEKLREELDLLERVERPKISQQIAEARDKGDLSENAEYDAAKEAQGMMEMRISKLKEKLAGARIIDESALDSSKVSILSTVKLKNKTNGMEMAYTLVPDTEADVSRNRIAISTPIAKGLLGKKAGESAEVTLPNGNKIAFEVLEISL